MGPHVLDILILNIQKVGHGTVDLVYLWLELFYLLLARCTTDFPCFVFPNLDTEQMLNFYFPKGLPTMTGQKRLAIDAGPCTRDHFYDLDHESGELLGDGQFKLKEEKSGNRLLLVPRKDNLYKGKASLVYTPFKQKRNYLFIASQIE